MKKIVLASNNSKKIKEIKEILKGLNYEVFSLNDMNINIDVEEDGKTFEENSQKKANEIYKYFHQLNILNEELLRKAAENFKIIINEDLLDGIIESIPKVWIYKEEDILKLKEYILYRLSNIDYMVEMILSYKKISGGI